jgi:methyltransferase-like protein
MQEVLARPGPGLYHDDLSPINAPVYFVQFASHAARYGLQFLAETQFTLGQEFQASADMLESLERISADTIQREQYLDFVECRRFRQTLLCRDSLVVKRDLNLEMLKSLKYVSLAHLASPELELNSSKAVKFAGSRRASIWTANPMAKAALQHLGENWPMPFTVEEIRLAARERLCRAGVALDSTLNDGQEALLQLLLTAYGAGLVEALPTPPGFVLQVSDRPVSSPVARLQLAQGNVVTSLLHTTFDVSDPLARQLILLLDGTRDRAAILQGLGPLIESGAVRLKRDNEPVTDCAGAMHLLAEQLEDALKNVARVPLLVA